LQGRAAYFSLYARPLLLQIDDSLSVPELQSETKQHSAEEKYCIHKTFSFANCILFIAFGLYLIYMVFANVSRLKPKGITHNEGRKRRILLKKIGFFQLKTLNIKVNKYLNRLK
jgi:hypothetical protein